LSKLKITPLTLHKDQVPLSKVVFLQFTVAGKGGKGAAKVILPNADINRRYFLSIYCPKTDTYVLDKTNKSLTFNIAVVLYQPVALKKVIPISIEAKVGGEEYVEHWFLPLVVTPNRHTLLDEDTESNDWWQIDTEHIEIIRKIGGGASASVFLAKMYGAEVAVKKWELGKKDAPPKDFKAELTVLRNLRHENLVLFIGGFCAPGNAFLVTEYLFNGSLDKFLQRENKKNKLSFVERVQMAIDGAKGMRYVHGSNKIHRDMKSLNLLVDERNSVKVADFGESRNMNFEMTQGTGTYTWMAPEVLTSKNYTAKADVFSFGIILWELLTEKFPERSMQDVERGTIPDVPPEYAHKYPEFVLVIKMCCRHDPNKRPSFNTIVHHLQNCKLKYDKQDSHPN